MLVAEQLAGAHAGLPSVSTESCNSALHVGSACTEHTACLLLQA